MANATTYLVWLQTLRRELSVSQVRAAALWCYHPSATYRSANPNLHACTKHVEVDFHFVRECIADKELGVLLIPSGDQVADGFTKPLRERLLSNLLTQFQLDTFDIEGGY